jgi:hypothetical protein
MIQLVRFVVAAVLFASTGALHAAPGYAIVVQEEVYGDEGWKKVCDALAEKHAGARLVKWKAELDDALPELQAMHPAFTCLVAPCTEIGPAFVAKVHHLVRSYDSDIYTDTRWGILSGYDAEAALGLARFDKPIEVKRVSSGTEFAMEMVEEGVWFDELVENKAVAKKGGAPKASEGKCPSDTTRLLADTLTGWNADLFITSGHGFRRGWQIGFRYKNGKF